MRAQKDFNTYRERFSEMYEDSWRILDRKRDILRDLEAGITSCPSAIDESLEKFKILYNSTRTDVEPPKAVKKFSTLFKSIFTRGVQPLLYSSVGDKASFDPFQKQVEYYTEDLKRNYRKVAKSSGRYGKPSYWISSTWRAPRQQRRNMKT